MQQFGGSAAGGIHERFTLIELNLMALLGELPSTAQAIDAAADDANVHVAQYSSGSDTVLPSLADK